METLVAKLDRLLRAGFEGARAQLEVFSRPHRVGGFLVWNGFAGMDADERIRRLYDYLREQLNSAEFAKVDLIMPVTLPEMEFRREQLEQEERLLESSPNKARTS